MNAGKPSGLAARQHKVTDLRTIKASESRREDWLAPPLQARSHPADPPPSYAQSQHAGLRLLMALSHAVGEGPVAIAPTTQPRRAVSLPETTNYDPAADRRQAGAARPSEAARFVSFGIIGGFVFLLGLAVQIVLVRRWHFDAISSYIIQGFISVQASFLLNRFWTWRDVGVPFFKALGKFNAQKIVTTIANTLAYNVLILSGMSYIIANVSITAIFTIINYITADKWVFGRQTALADVGVNGLRADDLLPSAYCPSVSIVVPCKDSQRTVRKTVASLLNQDYPNLIKVILVGSTGDATWQALEGIHDPRLVLIEEPPRPGRRDPNVKRDRGVQLTRSEIIAMVDSDIVMAPDWLSKGVALMRAARVQCVAGGMRTITDSFWGRFVDRTKLAAKTPRVALSYVVTKRNFGRGHRKPPITANVIITRSLYESCPLDDKWMYGYEDYEWFWRVVKSGYRILFSHELVGRHHHRDNFRALCREYLRASEGCARFVTRHPDCPFASKRRNQAVLLPLAALTAALVATAVVLLGGGALIAVSAVIGAIALVLLEYQGTKTVESLLYTPINLMLSFLFLFGLVRGLMNRPKDRSPVRAHEAVSEQLA